MIVHRKDACCAPSILSPNAAYGVRGDFDPEETLAVFRHAIEQALSDGFNGFRAAANMSWALDLDGGAERVITYEALLRSLVSSARATGLACTIAVACPSPSLTARSPRIPSFGQTAIRETTYDPTVKSLRAEGI